MKSFAKIVSALILASASVSAMAYPIATPTVSLGLDVVGNAPAPASFIFDLSNSNVNYIAGASTLDSAVLSLVFSDPLGGNEQYAVFLGNATTAALTGRNFNNNGTTPFDIVLDSVAIKDLMADGKILVTFKAFLQGGDDSAANYRVQSATLSATAVPEPATLGLMGVALAALGVSRRRKQK